MRKRILAILACFCLTCVVTTASGAGSESSLVSLSYLQGTYISELKNMIEQQVPGKMSQSASGAIGALEAQANSYINQLKPGEGSAWLFSCTPKLGGGERDDTIRLAAGSGIYWNKGEAVILSGLLLDVTDGVDISTGSALKIGHRYVSVQETTVTIVSKTAHWALEGQWQTTSDGISFVELPFTDVAEDSWYYDGVAYVFKTKLFNGTSETKFSPRATMNRGMLVTVLHRLASTPEVTYQPYFTDVSDGKWYTPGVIWAVENEISTGYPDGSFKPAENLKRQEIAFMLYNYAVWAGIDTTGRSDLSKFPDYEETEEWAVEAMSWAVASQIMEGNANGLLSPGDTTTRAQVSLMLQRFSGLVQ